MDNPKCAGDTSLLSGACHESTFADDGSGDGIDSASEVPCLDATRFATPKLNSGKGNVSREGVKVLCGDPTPSPDVDSDSLLLVPLRPPETTELENVDAATGLKCYKDLETDHF